LVGSAATLTATVTDTTGAAFPGAIVTFSVTSGPNAGAKGGGVTGSNGQAVLKYIGNGGAGTDTIQATVSTLTSNLVQQQWIINSLPAGSSCNGTFNGTFNGNLTITAGQTCVLMGTVNGNVTLTGGSLSISNGAVAGNLHVQGGGALSIGPRATVDGNLQIQNVPASAGPSQVCGATVKGNLSAQDNAAAVQIGSSSPGCQGNTISGNLQVQDNSGATTIYGNTVSGNVEDQSNTGATQVINNTVSGNLVCQGNTSITGSGNTANGQKQGQCAGF
jgi:hypothetical protein